MFIEVRAPCKKYGRPRKDFILTQNKIDNISNLMFTENWKIHFLFLFSSMTIHNICVFNFLFEAYYRIINLLIM